MKFITIEETVAACSTIIKNPSREDRLLFRMWIWIAEKQIGCIKSNIKTDSLSVLNLVARKPDDFLSTIDFALIDNKGNDVRYRYKGQNGKRVHPITGVNNPRMIDVYEDDNLFYLDSNGSNIELVNVRYRAYPIDSNGLIKIPEDHLYAIMIFVNYMYSMRESISLSRVHELKLEWKVQAAKARGKNKMPNTAEGREIMNSWNSLIPKGVSTKYSTY